MIKEVEKVISPVYMVGGSVRDMLMGVPPKDFDFTTAYSPDQIEAKVREAGRHPYLVGKRFGTVGLKVGGQVVEITTFRAEVYEPGSRKPRVEYVKDINEDLSRRDFTINAIALRDERTIDPFNGRADIAAKIIRAVGKATERIKEDPLRILRGARFASQLDFEIDPEFEKASSKLAYKILEVSKERWVQELDKLLIGKSPTKGLDFLARTRVLNFIIPEMAIQVGYDQNSRYHDLTLWEHTLATVGGVPADKELRWGAFLHDIAKPYVRTNKPDRSNYVYHDLVGAEMVKKLARYLNWSNDRREVVGELVRTHLEDNSPLRKSDNNAKKSGLTTPKSLSKGKK